MLATILIFSFICAIIAWFIELNIKWHRAGERCGCLGNCKKCDFKCQINPKYWGTKPPKTHHFLTGKRGEHGERL